MYCEYVRLCIRAFHSKVLSFFSLSLSLVIPQFGVQSDVSSLGLSSGHAGPVLTLSTGYAACASLTSPCSLVVDASICGLLLHWQLRLDACSVLLLLLIFLAATLPSEITKLPTDLPVRGFPTVWKVFLLQDSLPNSFVSLFIFYILSYLLSMRMGCLSGCFVPSASI